MDANSFEANLRSLEYFHGLRLLPRAWTIVRVDGRGFTRFADGRFERPFDPVFHEHMVAAAEALLTRMGGLYAYTESDEISILFPRDWDFFDRSLEKVVSISAAIASSVFSVRCGEPVEFDSRVWLGAEDSQVVDYFRWRQSDAGRCALNGWCYWTLRKEGRSPGEATAELERGTTAEKNELLFQRGINFGALPLWQRRGTGVYWETYQKEGFNPKLGEAVTTSRRRVRVDRELPMREDYAAFIGRLLSSESRLAAPPAIRERGREADGAKP